MKISEVCKQTDLTKRAVRFYTEKGLLAPATVKKESRDYYEYSEEDVRLLKAISALRKLDISIDDIGKIISEPESIPEIVSHYREHSREQYKESNRIQSILSSISSDKCTDIYSLAQCVESAGRAEKLPRRDAQPNFARLDDMTEVEKQEALMKMHDDQVIKKYRRDKKRIVKKIIWTVVIILVLFIVYQLIFKIRPVSFEYSGTGCIFDSSDYGRFSIIDEVEVTLTGTTYMNWSRFVIFGEPYECDRYAVGTLTIKTSDKEYVYNLTAENNEASYGSRFTQIHYDILGASDGYDLHLFCISYDEEGQELYIDLCGRGNSGLELVSPIEIHDRWLGW